MGKNYSTKMILMKKWNNLRIIKAQRINGD